MNIAPPTQLSQKQRWALYQQVFGTPEGEAVLEDMQMAHYVYSSMIGRGPVDPLRLAMQEGERNAVLRIMAILESKESDYV